MLSKTLEQIVFEALKDDFMEKNIHDIILCGKPQLEADSYTHLKNRIPNNINYPMGQIYEALLDSVDFVRVDELLNSHLKYFSHFSNVVTKVIKDETHEAREVAKIEATHTYFVGVR